MSIPLTINGVTYQYPVEFDTHWGPTLTNWSSAVTSGMLQTSGVNPASLITSATANPAQSGFLELAKTDTISWRNNANSADLPLGINGSNQLTFNGSPIGAATALTDNHIFVGNASNQPADVAMSGDATIVASGALTIANGAVTNAKIAASTGITLSKLAALTASELVVSDSSGFLASLASPSLTEIGYVAGVTSAIQTQIDTLTTDQGNYLLLSGGTMTGMINMGSHKIISLTQGSNTGEAISFPVSYPQMATNAITNFSQQSASAVTGVTSITTTNLTTVGGFVLVTGCASISINTATVTGRETVDFEVTITRDSASNVIYSGRTVVSLPSGVTSVVTIPISCTGIDQPTAAIHTYGLSYGITAGVFISVQSYSLNAIEFRA